ncbi:MAG: LysR substrate-binding domain-containing protein [Gordonia sp. (in: high G+C Gram-positive bacteria)]
MFDIGALRALQAVASLGTVAAAADHLGFTASAVSQQIKRLEKQLGVAVLAPAGRRVVLTPAGQVLVDSAPEVFATMERCAQAARSVAGDEPRGTLRIAAFSTGVRGLVAPAVAELRRRHPDVDVRITEMDPGQAIYCVDAGTVDLALVHDTQDSLSIRLSDTLTQRLLHTDVGDVVMRRSHPLAAGDGPLSISDVVSQRWVASPEGTFCYQWLRRQFPSAPDIRHQIDDFSTQIALVSADDVLALIPRLARPALRDDVTCRPLQHPPTRDVHAVWRRSADAGPAVQALLTALDDVAAMANVEP